MEEKWIGEKVDTSGSYYAVKACSELKRRLGGKPDAEKLYKFDGRFGEEYYITDEEVIENIEKLNNEESNPELYEFLYQLVIEKFGMIEFLVRIGHKIAEQRDDGYRNGKLAAQKEMRKALGLE